MSLKAVINYNNNDFVLNDIKLTAVGDQIEEVIRAIRFSQNKSDEFLTSMISTIGLIFCIRIYELWDRLDLKEEPHKKIKLDAEDEEELDDESPQDDNKNEIIIEAEEENKLDNQIKINIADGIDVEDEEK